MGSNLRLFGFLARSVRSWMQCARQLNRYVQLVSCFVQIFSSVHSPMCGHSWSKSLDRNAVKRHLGVTVSMWDAYYQPVNISTDHALTFFYSYFCTFFLLHGHLCISYYDELLRSCIVIGFLAWKSDRGFLRVKTDPTSKPQYPGDLAPPSQSDDFNKCCGSAFE